MSKKIAFLFPGQGSQSVGMARDIAEQHPAGRAFIDKADAILGRSLSRLMWEGPEEDLKLTENTQPALFVSSAATLQCLNEAGIKPFAAAGHSLGEYSALYAAGVFSYEDGVTLVATRGQAFARAGKARKGAMSAVIGLSSDVVRDICQIISRNDFIVVPANYNEPMQTVISGDPAAVEDAGNKCKEAGAKRVLPLPVSGAFHSPLVSSAAEVMSEALRTVTLHKPQCHFVCNYTANELTEPIDIRKGLVEQVTSSVRWYQSIERLVALGVEAFVEVGSGKVLCGLAKRVAKDIPCHSTENWESLQKTIAELKN